MRGRKPLAANVHELNGNPGHRDIAARREAEPRPANGSPPRPTWLCPEGKKAWKFLIGQMETMGTLAQSDLHALATVCQAAGLYERAMRRMEKDGEYVEGRTGLTAHPAMGVAQKQSQILMRLLPEFGLTPSGRARVAIRKTERGDDDGGILGFIGRATG